MKVFSLLSAIFIAIVLFPGCAYFTSPKEQPVQQDQVGPLFGKKTTHVFSLTPERRTVIVMPQEEFGAKFCAEPPPDVAENLADTLRLLAEAQVKGPKLPISASAELYKAFTSSAMRLFYRSQGIQLFRDGMYNLCQAYINEAIDEKEYMCKYKELLEVAADLIMAEMPQLEEKRINDAVDLAKEAETVSSAASEDAKIAKEAAQKAARDAEEILKEIKEIQKTE